MITRTIRWLKALPRVSAHYLSGGENMSLQCMHQPSSLRSKILFCGLLLVVGLLLFPQSSKAEVEGRPCELPDMLIEYGDLTTCRLESGASHTYRFVGTMGESVVLQMTRQ